MKIKAVVNLFAGPGVGKSTLASEVFVALKKMHYNVELINEYAKDLTWEGRHNVLEGDQIYIFAKQHRRILRVKDDVDIVVCDSPLVLSMMYYNEDKNLIDKRVYQGLVFHAFSKYPNVNFLINRDLNIPYQENGRNQTLKEALLIDKRLRDFLEHNNVIYTDVYLPDAVTNVIKNLSNFI